MHHSSRLHKAIIKAYPCFFLGNFITKILLGFLFSVWLKCGNIFSDCTYFSVVIVSQLFSMMNCYRVQGYNVQKPLPGQHMRTIPALGMLLRVCHESRGTSTWGADCSCTRARPTVRRIRTRMPSSVPCICRAVSKSSAVYGKAAAAAATPASSGCWSTSVVTQLIWFSLCLVTMWQSRSLLIVIYVVFRKLSSIMLCLLRLYGESQLRVCVIILYHAMVKVIFNNAPLLLLVLFLFLFSCKTCISTSPLFFANFVTMVASRN